MKARKKPSSKAAVILTQRALADLLAVKRYSLETWGRRTADKYLDGISSALDRLRATPHILQDLPDFATGLYFYRVGKHYLACDFDGSTIIVLTVIHTSMDIPARLSELQPQLIIEVQYLRERLRRQADTRR